MGPLVSLVLLSIIFHVSSASELLSIPNDKQCQDMRSYLQGSVPPAYCAFTKNSSLNTDVIPDYAHYFHKHNVTAVLINHPSVGCDRLSAEERRQNAFEWVKVSKTYGFKIIVYVPPCSYPDLDGEFKYLKQQNVFAVMVGADYNWRYNSTYLRVEYLYELAKKVEPIYFIIDFDIKLREGNTDNAAKLHRTALHRIPNYIGFRGSTNDIMEAVADKEAQRCSVFLGYDSLSIPLVDKTHISGISSYACSVYPGYANQILEAVRGNKPVKEANSLLLEANRKIILVPKFLNAENYGWSTFIYVEVIMREYFVCVSGIDVGRSRQSYVYISLNGLRSRFRLYVGQHGITCKNKYDGDEKNDKEDKNDKN